MDLIHVMSVQIKANHLAITGILLDYCTDVPAGGRAKGVDTYCMEHSEA